MMDSASKWITRTSLIAVTALAIAATHTPLTNEAIVRMTRSSLSEPEILRAIREAELVQFDLSAEVVSEMRLVGVTETVIKAMHEKAASAVQPGVVTQPDEGTIDVIFEQEKTPGTGKLRGLAVPRAAFFLICIDPTHVPDHWTTRTPMVENFPRHHLLWFHEPPLLAEDADGGRLSRAKRLPLPAPSRVTTAAGSHPIMAGIAIWSDEQAWLPLAMAERTLEVAAGATTRLVLSVALHKPPAKQPVTVVIVEPAAPSAEGSPAP